VEAWLAELGLLAPARGAPATLRNRTVGALRRRVPQAIQAPIWRRLPDAARTGLRGLREAAERPDWSRTRAYFVQLHYPTGGINVNLRGREPSGIVAPGPEHDGLVRQIADALRHATHPKTGEAMVTDVWRSDELYSGPYRDAAPDLIFRLADAYVARSGLRPGGDDRGPFSGTGPSGNHRPHGVLILACDGVFRPATTLGRCGVADVTPTLLHAMGLPVPGDLDGRVLDDAFLPEFSARCPIMPGETLGGAGAPGSEYAPDEAERVRAALRALGYLE
jgi:predicted AlkP superfamily phosphohydrolase/phosphomutase